MYNLSHGAKRQESGPTAPRKLGAGVPTAEEEEGRLERCVSGLQKSRGKEGEERMWVRIDKSG